MARYGEKPLSARFGLFDCQDVRECEVAHVDEEVVPRRWALVFCGAGDQVSYALVGGVSGG